MVQMWIILTFFGVLWTTIAIIVIFNTFKLIEVLFFTPDDQVEEGITGRSRDLITKSPKLGWERVKEELAKEFLKHTLKKSAIKDFFNVEEGDLPEGMEGILGEIIATARDNPEMVKEFLEGFRKGKSDEVQDEAFM